MRCKDVVVNWRWGSVTEYHCNLDFPSTAAILEGVGKNLYHGCEALLGCDRLPA